MLINDEPTELDLLDRAWLADELAVQIAECTPPYVLGVHGDWGAGKTSFLRLLRARLEAPWTRCRVVDFEAWRHQFETQPVIALLHAIRSQLRLSTRVRHEAGKLALVTAETSLGLFDELLKSLGGTEFAPLGAAREAGERREAQDLSEALFSESIQDKLEAAVRQALGPQAQKLVVLIDDLDRCKDEAVVHLLEGLKLHLSAGNCVFVIAADRRAVLRALQRHLFRESEDPDVQARVSLDAAEYSEKLLQSVRALPLATDLDQLLCASWPQGDGVGAQVARLQTQLGFLPPNPRKAKRFMVELHGRLQGIRRLFPTMQVDLSLACAVQSLQTFQPAVYRVLEYAPAFWQEVVSFSQLGPQLERRHPVFRGLQVPDLAPATRPAAEAGPTWAALFHDPGDVSVFWASRIIRLHASASADALSVLLQRRPPRATGGELEAPEASPRLADLSGPEPR